jgi:tRNA(adenine34) deaminase
MLNISDERTIALIRICQEEAEACIAAGDPPFGCVLTDLEGNILMRDRNTQNSDTDPTGHAEINAIRKLCVKKASRRLDHCVLFSNAESCSMCMSAAIKAHIRHFRFGAPTEESLDPMLTPQDIAARSKEPLDIHRSILSQECADQIARGRSAKE